MSTVPQVRRYHLRGIPRYLFSRISRECMEDGALLAPYERWLEPFARTRVAFHALTYGLGFRCKAELESITKSPWVLPWHHKDGCPRCQCKSCYKDGKRVRRLNEL